ncbi:thioredoxin-dependent thiol peroxidase [Coralliovum pocilloporae]|uniref:thioredoxin-dependent thiol peroxidase n=1 Tax=Coralliovum pocilloporae TaxID=3066369 RepID=UPI003306DC94
MSDILTEGSEAPLFELPADRGEILSLNDHFGKPIVVYFYPKDDTPGCTKEAIAFTEHKAAFDKLGVKIVGISPDTVKKHDKFRDKYDLGISLASDEDKAVAMAYGVWVEKKMYGRTYMGIERSTFLIDSTGKLARIWRKVKVPGHVEAVLSAAEELS